MLERLLRADIQYRKIVLCQGLVIVNFHITEAALNGECPNPASSVGADTCAITNSECTGDISSSTGYKCLCKSQFIEDSNGNCLGSE